MAKSPNQKLKLLYLTDYLRRETDEQHPVSLAEIIEELSRHDIAAERKSVYDDIEALRLYGLDIIKTRGKTTGYYLASRDFELAELKLLVDSVQSSKFITRKKTVSLIKKIEGLCSSHEAKMLQRQVHVRNRVKSMNESVYYNVDEISNAINADRQIRFRYFEYTLSKERRFRHDGKFYELSPFALMWDNENYYMIAWDSEIEKMKHFRVDKMSQIEARELRREGKEIFAAMDMSAYSKQVFSMFTGELVPVRIRFAAHLIGAVLDRFGRELMVIPDGREHFIINIDAAVSPQFFSWLFAYGNEAEILSPPALRREMARRAAAVGGLYADAEKDNT